MQNITDTKKYFLDLVGSSICGRPVPLCPESVDTVKLYKLSVRNAVQSILYLAIKDGAVTLPDEILKKLEKSYMAGLMREASQQEETDFIKREFSKSGVDFMLLKGSHLKSLYPVPEMRFMVDMDILVREKDIEKCRDIILSRGFYQKADNGKDIILIKEPCLTVELHKALFQEGYFMHEYFCGVWNKAESAGNNEFKMTYNDLYVYTLAHLAEHYLEAGSCFRPVMDLYLMENKLYEKLDFEYITEQFKTLGIDGFASKIRRLCRCMFDGVEYDDDLEIMENYIVLGPPVNNADEASRAAVSQKSKVRRIFDAVFPNLHHMELRFPKLKKYPFLLPIYWVIRLFKYSFTKDSDIVKKREKLKHADKNSADIMRQIFEKSDLQFK
ncbi:MAG: nucleotidyltransferase family protein [Candidatus Fimenecus sp.]